MGDEQAETILLNEDDEKKEDVFRKNHRVLKSFELKAMNNIKTKAEELLAEINETPQSREKSLAITKLEESIMWVIKGITN